MPKNFLKSAQVNTYEVDKSNIYGKSIGISKTVSGSGTGGTDNPNGSNGSNGIDDNNITNVPFILTENNFYLLQENGFKINLI